MNSGDGARSWRRAFALLALLACALTLVVIVSSAFMRHALAGLSCADWPDCYGRSARAMASTPPGVYLARIGHRLAATGVALAIAAGLVWAWSQRESWRRERALALAALSCAAALAGLGVATPGASRPAVPLANLIGGYALFGLLAATWSTARDMQSIPRRVRSLAIVALIAAMAQSLVGGLIGTQFAPLACPALACDDASWSSFAAGGAWNPLRVPDVIDGRTVAPAGAAGLHVLHRILGGLVVLLALALALSVRRVRPRTAATIAALVAIAIALGVGAVSAAPVLIVVVMHGAAAALLVAALATLAFSPALGQPPRADVATERR